MTFSQQDLEMVQRFAESMSEQEICDYFGLRYEELNEADMAEFNTEFKRGRVNIRDYAMQKLKASCMGKSGMQASLAILTQFGSQWEKAGNMAGVKSFRIELDD